MNNTGHLQDLINSTKPSPSSEAISRSATQIFYQPFFIECILLRILQIIHLMIAEIMVETCNDSK
jgi:hypothetical protein